MKNWRENARRLCSLAMAAVMVLNMALWLVGCGKSEPEVTMGQWLGMITESFGMVNYQREEPYFKNVSSESQYFADFQKAAEWEILEPSDSLTALDGLTWKDAMVTLVNTGEFLGEDASEKDKINYAKENFGVEYRSYYKNRYIGIVDASAMLEAAQQQWATKTYDEPYQNIEFADSVKDYLEKEVDYATQQDGTIRVKADDVGELKEGDLFVLPAKSGVSGSGSADAGSAGTVLPEKAQINRAKSVEKQGDYYIITPDEGLTEQEVLENINVLEERSTQTVDFSRVSVIYDANGNPIYPDNSTAGNMAAENTDAKISYLGKGYGADIARSGIKLAEQTYSISVGDYSGKVKINQSGVSVGLEKELKSEKLSVSDSKTTAFVTTTVDKINITKDVDVSWGKLRSITFRTDFNQKIDMGVKHSKKIKVGQDLPLGEHGGINTIEEVKDYFSELRSDFENIAAQDGRSDDSIYICRIPTFLQGAVNVDIIVKATVTVEGSFKITVGCDKSAGFEYKNGNLAWISSGEPYSDFVMDGNASGTIGVGAAVDIIKFIKMGEFTANLGVGVSGSYTQHIVDEEMHEISRDDGINIEMEDAEKISETEAYTSADEILMEAKIHGGSWKGYEKGKTVKLLNKNCFEWKMYPLFNIKAGGGLFDLLKVDLTFEMLGPKSSSCLKGHIDLPDQSLKAAVDSIAAGGNLGDAAKALMGIDAECSYKFKPWDDLDESMEDPPEYSDILTGDGLQMSAVSMTLTPGGTAQITVQCLPEGYTLADVDAVSENEKIAKVDVKFGKITAGEETGRTTICFKTKDGKYKAYCAVFVEEAKTSEFVPLPDSLLSA